MDYNLLKYLHVIGAITLLGTGTGIAFFMVMAHRTKDAAFVARTAAVVVTADMIFTASAVIAQPITGYFLAEMTGADPWTGWLGLAILLYGVAGVFWLPVVWIQARMRDLARHAAEAGQALPRAYHRLYRIWFVFGLPGFGSVLAILWLMIARPSL
ncbi:hypothetical protein ASG43_03970 [Aureimonas sp. Leaf454]|uniref:DUF2269 family protein n=1 Tax=Aureimonas sp. Leaf454 TaxID=1736381 RepID=UPI0006F35F15|nr:DUF2269 domain-containing protein [Aureimonas sp. Leaf454]KQT54995.1 hypothetical protein ASG43_03970 [Aureimonas sp. Leaf454]